MVDKFMSGLEQRKLKSKTPEGQGYQEATHFTP